MIYLLVTVTSIAPLVILACLGRKKEEPTLLPFSTMDSNAPATSKEAPKEGMTAARAALKQPVPPRLEFPPQPTSDGHKDTVTSTTKNNTTDKQTASGRTDKQQGPLRPSCKMEGSPEKREPVSTGGLRRTAAPIRRNSPQTRTPGALTPGSRKSRKSRKAGIPRSPSWKELQAKTFKGKTPTVQSRTDVRTLPSNAGANNKSLNTALSEYIFAENKYKVIGKIDQIIAKSDEFDVLDKALNTEQSEITAEPHTDRARSPFFDGAFSVWIADRVGSQAEE